MGKTNLEFVEFAKSLLSNQAPTWYMYGVNGQRITESLIQIKKKQYPKQYTDDKIKILRTKIGKIGYDCSSIADVFTGQDKSADGWLANATEKGPIETIPELPGVTVHYPGHMGVYIGNGEVVEARGTNYGIVKTKLKDRPWKNWAKMPGIEYIEENDIMLKKGDKGEAVYDYQWVLKQLGYDMGTWADMKTGEKNGLDGSFGSYTETVTKKAQANYGLKQTGQVDFVLYGKLVRDLMKKTKAELENIKSESSVYKTKYQKIKDLVTQASKI